MTARKKVIKKIAYFIKNLLMTMRIFFEKSAEYIEGFLDCCINLLKRLKWIDCIPQ